MIEKSLLILLAKSFYCLFWYAQNAKTLTNVTFQPDSQFTFSFILHQSFPLFFLKIVLQKSLPINERSIEPWSFNLVSLVFFNIKTFSAVLWNFWEFSYFINVFMITSSLYFPMITSILYCPGHVLSPEVCSSCFSLHVVRSRRI